MRTKTLQHESKEPMAKVRQQPSAPMPRPVGMAASVLSLQRLHGNRFVQRLLRANAIQAKLSISQPGDEYEREADRIADRVMATPAHPGVSGAPQRIQRFSGQPTGQMDAAPASVDQAFAGSGRPLEPALQQDMEQRFGHDFSRVRVHSGAVAEQSTRDVNAHAYTVGQNIVFGAGRFAPGTHEGQRLIAHELTNVVQQSGADGIRAGQSDEKRGLSRFLPGTAHGKRLVAHELTHAIQQAATSPRIALSPEKERPAPAPGSLKFNGVLLGTNRNKEEVRVKREVGGTQGYDDRLQAIAVARLAKVEPSAVVLGTDRKWHALETTAAFEVGRVSANDPKASETAAAGNVPFVEVHGLPSLTGIEQSRQKVDELKAKLAELDARKTTTAADRKAVQTEKDQVIRDLTQANRIRAKFVLGVPESEIQFNVFSSGRTAGKVNITGQPGQGSTGGRHGPVIGQGGVEFTKEMITAFEIDLPQLEKPAAHAQSTLFHEVYHLKDYQFAQKWVKNYETEANRIFVRGAPGWKPFKEWLDAQVTKKRLTNADVELILDQTVDVTATTEARANVHTFLAVLQAGDPDQATKALVGYAHALKPKGQGGGGQYASPAPGSQVLAALVMELKTAYRQMPKNMQQQYDVAVAAAMKENPSAWISALKFSK